MASRSFLASFEGCVEDASGLGAEARLRYSCVAGSSWKLVHGRRASTSQIARATGRRPLVFDLPFDVAYESDTPFGWPQLVICAYGTNFWGGEVLLGYGRTRLPTTAGERHTKVRLFRPLPATRLAAFLGELTGKSPELVDPDALADGTDDHLLRTSSCGHVNVKFNLITKGLRELDYDNVTTAANA